MSFLQSFVSQQLLFLFSKHLDTMSIWRTGQTDLWHQCFMIFFWTEKVLFFHFYPTVKKRKKKRDEKKFLWMQEWCQKPICKSVHFNKDFKLDVCSRICKGENFVFKNSCHMKFSFRNCLQNKIFIFWFWVEPQRSVWPETQSVESTLYLDVLKIKTAE